jgi:hypothetical protein
LIKCQIHETASWWNNKLLRYLVDEMAKGWNVSWANDLAPSNIRSSVIEHINIKWPKSSLIWRSDSGWIYWLIRQKTHLVYDLWLGSTTISIKTSSITPFIITTTKNNIYHNNTQHKVSVCWMSSLLVLPAWCHDIQHNNTQYVAYFQLSV